MMKKIQFESTLKVRWS